MKKAGIIGASGFIGSHITKVFLDHQFEVKASTTDISKEQRYQHLMKLEHADNLVVCELNVTDKAALKDFITDCDIVIHAGTPFILDVTDPQTQLFEPTIKGTENFLSVISESPTIEKVVFVASVAAYNTNFPFPATGKNATDQYDETSPAFTSTESHPYAQAKFIANSTVEQFIKDHRHIRFEINSVSPVMVMGTSLSDRTDSTSGGMQFLFRNKLAPNPFVQMLYDNDVAFAIVDVADVAQAVFKAASKIGSHGKNYLLSSETYKVSDISRMLNQQEPTEEPIVVYKNDLASKDLGITFRPVKETLYNYSRQQESHHSLSH